MEQMGVSAVVPAFNEADRIGETVQAIRSIAQVSLVCVIDDGSTDQTASRAEQAGAQVWRLPRNAGKAAALNVGVTHCPGDVLLLADGDLGESARRLEALLPPILTDQADMAIADFVSANPAVRGGGMGWARDLAGRAIWELTGWRAHSPLSGQRALRRVVWQAAAPLPPGFGVEVALTIRALRRGFRVVEIPVVLAHRVTGWSWRDVWHRTRQWWAIRQAVRQCRRETQAAVRPIVD